MPESLTSSPGGLDGFGRTGLGDVAADGLGGAQGENLGGVGGDELAAMEQADEAGRVVGGDDGDLVDVQLGQATQGGVQVVERGDRQDGAGGKVGRQDEGAEVGAEQGEPDVAEGEDAGQPPVAVQ